MSMERRETKKASMASRAADRISALPNDLLHHVLSFLAAHKAVSTSLLGRRWRHLWKSAPALRVTGVKGCHHPARFVNFVHNLLLLRDPRAHLDSFQLDLDDRDFDFEAFLPANDAHLNTWFRHAVMCGPRLLLALRTTNGVYEYPDDCETFRLLNAPLASRHLTRLELKTAFLCSSTLDFSGCPALAHLSMENCDIRGNISSPFLKHLSIVDSFFQTDPFRAHISLPRLVSLELTGLLRRAPVLESMPLLLSAIVRLERGCHDSCTENDLGDCGKSCSYDGCYGCHDSQGGADDRRGESVLLQGLSEVTELELSAHSKVYILNRDFKLCPTFSKLKTLLLSKWCPYIHSDLNVLSCFLKYSPILEKLTLQLSEAPKEPVVTQRSYTLSGQSFPCSHLKILEIKCNEVDAWARKVVDILSTHGVPRQKVRCNFAFESLGLTRTICLDPRNCLQRVEFTKRPPFHTPYLFVS
ncbi:unnamed protein product [Alopecurus aequalis]